MESFWSMFLVFGVCFHASFFVEFQGLFFRDFGDILDIIFSNVVLDPKILQDD